MRRNQCQNNINHVLVVVIEDTNYVDDVIFDSTRVDSPQYDFVSKLPLFLRGREEFIGIQNDLKKVIAQGKPLNSDNTCPLSGLEQVYWEKFTWIQRYYQDIPYLQARINQVLAQNIDLERENSVLRADMQQTSPREKKRSKK